MSIFNITREGRIGLDISDLEPVAFYPYTSIVQDGVISFYDSPEFNELQRMMIENFRRSGIKAYADNKTVFQMAQEKTGRAWFIGFKDGRIDVGFRVRSDLGREPITKDTK